MSTQVFPGTPFVQRHEVSVKDVNEYAGILYHKGLGAIKGIL